MFLCVFGLVWFEFLEKGKGSVTQLLFPVIVFYGYFFSLLLIPGHPLIPALAEGFTLAKDD